MKINVPAFVKWQGSKNKQAKNIIPIIDSIERLQYVEPFGGAGAIFLNKKIEKYEIYNDLNFLFSNLFRVVRSRDGARQLQTLSNVFPMSREFWKELRGICIAEIQGDKIKRDEMIKKANLSDFSPEVVLAWSFFYCQNTGFGGNFFLSYGGGEKITESSSSFCAITYKNKCSFIQEFSQRFKNVQIENIDAFDCLKKYEAPETLFYIDPPYDVECSKDYKTNWDVKKSQQLVNKLKTIDASVVLSCYDSNIYQELFDFGYKRKQFDALMSVCKTKREKRIETVYFKKSNWAIKQEQNKNIKTFLFEMK